MSDAALAYARREPTSDQVNMWILIMRSPWGEPAEFTLKPGKTTIGRSPDNDIAVPDQSASRSHAELEYDESTESLVIRDLNSTNGTFVHRERITGPHTLQSGDVVRIGEHVLTVHHRDPNAAPSRREGLGTQPLTRDLVLEALDHHAVLLYKIARQLNTVLDIDTALREVSSLLRVSMGADKCEVILAEQFTDLNELGFPTTIARMAIDQQTAIIIPDMPPDSEKRFGKSALLMRLRSALCVPVMAGDDLLALIYMYKTDPESRPFDENDLHLAVAISHQAALTIQRTQLIKSVQKEQQVRVLLQRFLSPPEAEYIMRDYARTGLLPGLTERRLTVLFADIMDSTGLAEQMGAKRFGELLSKYYHEMTNIIFQNGGVLDKYLGDGLMAVFGMTDAQPDPEVNAIRAGLTMLDRLEFMNSTSTDQIGVGIGINTGLVVAGYVGTDERVEFTVLGDTVNVAYMLEAHARPNRIVIGPGTTGAVAGHFNLRRVGPVEVKGRTKPVQAHEVLREPLEMD